jgi:hypothetical protein
MPHGILAILPEDTFQACYAQAGKAKALIGGFKKSLSTPRPK